jgi:hypothetical protein
LSQIPPQELDEGMRQRHDYLDWIRAGGKSNPHEPPSITDLQERAIETALHGFAKWVAEAAAKWDRTNTPHPTVTYVANVMARQYANHLLGRDPDADWPGGEG